MKLKLHKPALFAAIVSVLTTAGIVLWLGYGQVDPPVFPGILNNVYLSVNMIVAALIAYNVLKKGEEDYPFDAHVVWFGFLIGAFVFFVSVVVAAAPEALLPLFQAQAQAWFPGPL
ncbi:MAG: hypothetical protein WCT49_03785 [Candidatus Paceibacterota bacterium]|jgi:hypothetical protein|nr:hypothetical protein [Candidatus Paceibacterota bacterium]